MDILPEVSFIIPVYNGGEAVCRSVRSVLSQSLLNIEVIIVDDGSDEYTRALCLAEAESDPRARLIRQENAGVSAARKAGLDAARGRRVFFLDCDDYIAPDTAELLVAAAEKHSADIVCCPVCLERGDRKSWARAGVDGVWDGERLRELHLMMCRGKPDITVSLVNKLYRRELLAELDFPRLVSGEDSVVALDAALAAERIYFTEEKPLYFYVISSQSFTQRKISLAERVRQSDLFYDGLCEVLRRRGLGDDADFAAALTQRRAVSLYCFARLACDGENSRKDALAELKYISELENYRCADSTGLPAYYRVVLSALAKKRLKTARFILRFIRKVKKA